MLITTPETQYEQTCCHWMNVAQHTGRRNIVCDHSKSEIGGLTARRHFFLDATLLMRGHPQEHLLVIWAGILQQQQDQRGEQRPDSPAQLRRRALALWAACAGATLLSCHGPGGGRHSRCTTAGCVLFCLPHHVHKL